MEALDAEARAAAEGVEARIDELMEFDTTRPGGWRGRGYSLRSALSMSTPWIHS